MQTRLGSCHAFAFSCAALLCMAAACLGLFLFLTHDRGHAAHIYFTSAQTYYNQTRNADTSEQSRDYLLRLAEENILRSLRLNDASLENWALAADILRDTGKRDLAQKAQAIAGQASDRLDIVHPQKGKWKSIILADASRSRETP